MGISIELLEAVSKGLIKAHGDRGCGPWLNGLVEALEPIETMYKAQPLLEKKPRRKKPKNSEARDE